MWYRFVKIIFSVLFRIILRLKIIGRENIPMEGPVVIASNHMSLLDPPVVGTASSRPVNFMAKSELFVPVLGALYSSLGAFPVHRGAADSHAIKHALLLLKNKQVLGIFPEGHRMPKGHLGKAAPGALAIAIKGKATVVPTAIIGSDLKHRKTFWPKVTVVFGKPLSMENQDGNKVKVEELSERLMAQIAAMIEAHREK